MGRKWTGSSADTTYSRLERMCKLGVATPSPHASPAMLAAEHSAGRTAGDPASVCIVGAF